MWRVMFVLLVLGMLSGCNETQEERSERIAEAQNADATDRVKFHCVEGYLFVERRSFVHGEGVGLSQFWEVGPNGQPRPRVCGGE